MARGAADSFVTVTVTGASDTGREDPSSPFRYCRRQVVGSDRQMPCRRAVAVAWRWPMTLSSTIQFIMIGPTPTAITIGGGKNFNLRAGDKFGHEVGLTIGLSPR